VEQVGLTVQALGLNRKLVNIFSWINIEITKEGVTSKSLEKVRESIRNHLILKAENENKIPV
jgi:hypothetical protein